jgi:trans-aconitate methyltransferase
MGRGLYLKFSTERTQPSIDLIQRIALADPHRIVDLGCGPGNSTEALRRRWPGASITGLDSSPEMIEAARQGQAYPSGAWEVAAAARWSAQEPCDLVFADTLLQWIPDHQRMCRRLMEQVAPGEALAGDEERRDFERKVLDRYIEAYPRRAGGRVLFPFQRLFFVAWREYATPKKRSRLLLREGAP